MTQHRSGGDRSTRTRRNQAPLPKNPRRGPAAGAQREGACRAPCDCVYAARESERASETACARASTDRQATAATHQSTLQPLTLPLIDSAHEPRISRCLPAKACQEKKKCRGTGRVSGPRRAARAAGRARGTLRGGCSPAGGECCWRGGCARALTRPRRLPPPLEPNIVRSGAPVPARGRAPCVFAACACAGVRPCPVCDQLLPCASCARARMSRARAERPCAQEYVTCNSCERTSDAVARCKAKMQQELKPWLS
jgi:hypothetical protein